MKKRNLFVIVLMLVSFNSVFAENDTNHLALRNAVARDYFNPEMHLNLANLINS